MGNGKRQLGFTLIELIIVIIVLAVLAVAASGKYVELNRDAEIASAKQYATALQQAVTLANTRWRLNGHNARVNDLQGYANNNLDMNDNGYPLGIDKNNPMGQAFNIGKQDKACAELWQALLTEAPSIAFDRDNADYRSYRHSTHGNLDTCTFVLRKLGDLGDQSTGQIKIVYDSVTGRVNFKEQP